MITIKPQGGLCNRLRTLGAALALSRKINVPLRLIWERNSKLNCTFRRLFQVSDSFSLSEVTCNDNVPPIVKRIRNLREILVCKFRYGRAIFPPELEKLYHDGYDFEMLAKNRSVFITTWRRFYPFGSELSELKPVADLQNIINSYTTNFSGHTIGVHIRRTDNIQSIKHSPTSEFIKLMTEEIEKDEKVEFYLATDSPGEESEILRLFPNRITTHEKTLDRQSEKAIMDALVDLICLAKTKQIIGSYWSSFSLTASRFYEAKLRIVDVIKQDG